jgi:hypothetical protein
LENKSRKDELSVRSHYGSTLAAKAAKKSIPLLNAAHNVVYLRVQNGNVG